MYVVKYYEVIKQVQSHLWSSGVDGTLREFRSCSKFAQHGTNKLAVLVLLTLSSWVSAVVLHIIHSSI